MVSTIRWMSIGGLFLAGILMGCSGNSAEEYNRRMAQEEYSKEHDECWRLFSRIDPQLKKEYQDCMKQKGWLIK